MILLMMINTEKLEVLEHCLENLVVIITNQQEPMMVLQEKRIITLNIRAKELDMKIDHLKDISM